MNNQTEILTDEGNFEMVEMVDSSKMHAPLGVLYLFSFLFLVSFIRTQCTDIQSKNKIIVSKELEKETCGFCDVIRRPDMYHCTDCDLCIEGFDHHCGVVGVCIGDPNMKYFC